MEQTFEIQNKYLKYRINIQHIQNKYSAYRIKTQSAPHRRELKLRNSKFQIPHYFPNLSREFYFKVLCIFQFRCQQLVYKTDHKVCENGTFELEFGVY